MIGDPVSFSISHKVYPVLFKEHSLEGTFEKIKLPPSSLKDFFLQDPPFDFITVTMPHKKQIMNYCDVLSEDAKAIGAVNFITNINGKLKGFNFDGIGALDPIERRVSVNGKEVVVMGAGGGARAVIYEAKKRGAMVTLVNRTKEKGMELAKEFDVDFQRVIPFEFDVLINATSVGMDPADQTKLVTDDTSLKGVTVLDMASRDGRCYLKTQTINSGGEYISGGEMFSSLTHFGFNTYLDLCNLPKIRTL